MKRPERPSAVLVVAILQICFGTLALLGNLCGGGAQLAGGAKMFAPPPGRAQAPPDVEGLMRAKIPYYTALQYGGLVLGLIVGTWMIVSAIGLIKMRRWARWMTIGYACYNIVSSILGFIFALTVTLPVTKEIMAEIMADPKLPPQAAGILRMTETFTTAIVYASLVFMAYPITLLVIMFHPLVRAAFAGQTSEPEDERDDDGFDEEDEGPGDEGVRPGQTPDAPREEGIQPGGESAER